MSSIQKNFTAILLGGLLYGIWILFVKKGYVPIGHFHISIGHLGYLILLSLHPFRIKWHPAWTAAATLALLDLLHLIYLTNDRTTPPISRYLIYMLGATLVLLLMVWTLERIKSDTFVSGQSTIVVALSALITISTYHLINFYLKYVQHVPNEQRSIMIGGLEIHHINYGIILLVFVPLLFHATKKSVNLLSVMSLVFIGFIYGTVFDESFYYMLDAVTDDAYFSPPIIGLQSFFAVFVFLSWVMHTRWKNHHA